MLETIQEDKQTLNPNTEGMSLALTGSNLIEEEEKRIEAPPTKPDTNGINLVPNFDS